MFIRFYEDSPFPTRSDRVGKGGVQFISKGGWVMVHGRGRSIFAVTLICFLLYTGTEIALANGAPRISKEELRAMLGNPDLIIVDARTSGSWEESKLKIQGAVREDPKDAKSWAEKYSKDKTLVLYCT
jgi:hypothetical protein